jgi:hypothetical protein
MILRDLHSRRLISIEVWVLYINDKSFCGFLLLGGLLWGYGVFDVGLGLNSIADVSSLLFGTAMSYVSQLNN